MMSRRPRDTASWMPCDDVGPRQHAAGRCCRADRGRWAAKRSPRKSASVELVALDHGAHRAIDEQQPALTRFLQLQGGRTRHRTPPRADVRRPSALRAAPPALRPLATSTVNGSPFKRAPTSTRTSSSPARKSQSSSDSSRKPEPAVAEPLAHPVLAVRPQFEHQHRPPGFSARTASHSGAHPVSARGAAPATTARRRPRHRRAAAPRCAPPARRCWRRRACGPAGAPA